MQRIVAGTCIVVGSLAALATACFGILGAAFGAFSGPGGTEGLVVLLVGPLSILPAGLVGRKRPVIAGLWLLADALFCFFMFFVVDPDGFGELFQPHPPLAAVGFNAAALFVALLGFCFLWTRKEQFMARTESPEFRRRFMIIAIPLFVGLVLSVLAWWVLIPR